MKQEKRKKLTRANHIYLCMHQKNVFSTKVSWVYGHVASGKLFGASQRILELLNFKEATSSNPGKGLFQCQ